MKTALVTGANGHAGAFLCPLLLDQGYRVIGIIRRSSTDTRSRILPMCNNNNFSLLEGDITDSTSVNEWFLKYSIDECYNLAAQSHVATSFIQPKLTYEVNYGGVLNILEAIRHLSPKTKFLTCSTSEMFGRNYDMQEVHSFSGIQEIKYQDENTKFMPMSPYAISKVAAHQLVDLYRRSYGLYASCPIMFNYESQLRGEQFVTRKITKWIGQYKKWFDPTNEIGQLALLPEHDNVNYLYNSLCNSEGFPKLRLGNLDSYRDWGYAKDYMMALNLILQQETPDDYVIATGETHSIREFLEEAFTYARLGDWKKYVVQDKEFMRPAEVDYLCGRADKAKKVLGWQPKTSFKELVHLMVDHDIKMAKT